MEKNEKYTPDFFSKIGQTILFLYIFIMGVIPYSQIGNTVSKLTAGIVCTALISFIISNTLQKENNKQES